MHTATLELARMELKTTFEAKELLDPGAEYPGRKQFDCGHAATNKFVRDSLLARVKKKLGLACVLCDSSGKGRQLGSLPKKFLAFVSECWASASTTRSRNGGPC